MPNDNDVDIEDIFFSLLTKKGTELHMLVGDRVWSPSLPSHVVWNNELPAIVFMYRERIEEGYHDVNVIFKCYGGSSQHKDALKVSRKLYDRLHNNQSTTHDQRGLLMAVHESTSPERYEPDTIYPVVIVNYHCIVV